MATYDELVRAYEAGVGVDATPLPPVDPGANLAATLPVWALAGGAVAAFATAADRWRETIGVEPLRGVVEPDRVAASFSSERLFRIDGERPSIFAELSGFFRAADAWVRTHANYSHHRDRLLTAVALPATATRADFVRRVATLSATDIEQRAAEHGAIAVRVRAEQEWADSPQGKAAASGPLVALERRADTGAVESPTAATRLLPLRGLRVLDLTRVIAGPVATRALALLGADVLRIDPPFLPEIGWQYLDTCQGKRSTVADLRTDLPVFRELISNADIIISGYRPGRLERLGVRPGEMRAGIVYGRVSAWGETGPWGDRRGFDSIVQAASGISLIEGAHDNSSSEPSVGALPAQALDHASGYLLAAGVLDALRARQADGGGRDVRVALARTASWLLGASGRTPDHEPAAAPDPSFGVSHGAVTTAGPALTGYPDYPWPARDYGSDTAEWKDRPEGS
ncbi:CoA transferase [Nocardia sp. CDC153]|uniref:CoA transferase n=1 Tax=Nocardia sp. CDC153 TaxID=3112167 RepID=UPI002DB7D541|nr:CoA transferase [Nocardia sp. CDC153]MEC3956660.1 CoA transferase [Nocardia sp. CDC153]